MEKSEKASVFVAYDKKNGRIILTHQEVSLDPKAVVSEKESKEEIKRILSSVKPDALKNINITSIKIKKEALPTLIAINPKTKKLIFEKLPKKELNRKLRK